LGERGQGGEENCTKTNSHKEKQEIGKFKEGKSNTKRGKPKCIFQKEGR